MKPEVVEKSGLGIVKLSTYEVVGALGVTAGGRVGRCEVIKFNTDN